MRTVGSRSVNPRKRVAKPRKVAERNAEVKKAQDIQVGSLIEVLGGRGQSVMPGRYRVLGMVKGRVVLGSESANGSPNKVVGRSQLLRVVGGEAVLKDRFAVSDTRYRPAS